MGEEREAMVVVCKTGSKIRYNMDDKFEKKIKRYNLIMTIIGISGVVLLIISFVVEGSRTEKIFTWTGFAAMWGVVMMKFLHPSLSSKNRNRTGTN
jgi:hypothetical protein